MKRIELTWHVGDATGYTDLLPLDLFKSDVTEATALHRVRGPRGGIHHARFRLTVTGRVATVDYSAFPSFNRRNGMQLGTLEIHFADEARSKPVTINWDSNSVVDDATWTIERGDKNEKLGLPAHQPGGLRLAVDRPGQAEFHRRVEEAYGGSCCISGCDVPASLEAAHIKPFNPLKVDVVANGLLLRADLHALFDQNQLVVEPKSRLVFFAPEARGWDEYDRSHAKASLANPQRSYSGARPTDDQFAERWITFVTDYGDPRHATKKHGS